MVELSALERLVASLPWEGERTLIALEEAEADGGRVALSITRDQARLGRIEIEAQDQQLIAWSLVVETEFRGYGAGSESAHRLRDEAQAAGFEILRAVAAPDLGLSVYFWTRMGLHPLHGEGPGGGLWFERRLS